MKKVYMTIETERPHDTLATVLDNLDGEEGVVYAEGRIGWSGQTEKRRYELEKQFQGLQPEDFGIKRQEQASPKRKKGRRRR